MTESEDSRAPVPKRGSSAMTEPERLRGEARRALKVARAINDEKATKSLEAYRPDRHPAAWKSPLFFLGPMPGNWPETKWIVRITPRR